MRLLEFCGETVPRPRQLLTMRRAMAAFAAAFGVLTALAAFSHTALLGLDEPVSDWVRGSGNQDVWRLASLPGATEFYVPLALVPMVLLWNRCRSLAITWPALIAVGIVVNLLTKLVVDRPRPPVPDTGVALAAYPSGHTIHATVVLGLLAPTLYLLTRRSLSAWIAYPLLLGTAVVTGLSRVALGAHWMTDVVAGHLIGLALLICADLVIELHHREAMPDLERLRPAKWPTRV